MAELNPYHWSIFLSVILSFPAFYLVGQFFVNRLKNPTLSIAYRMAIGMLVSLSILASVYTKAQTGFVFYMALFLFMGIDRRFKVDMFDLKGFGFKRTITVLVLVCAFVGIEGHRANVVVEEGVYVGNSDVAHYASYGYGLFESGVETNPEKINPESSPTIYHFGDLWLNGMYSYFFNVLPYYSSIIVSRVLMIVFLLLIVYGWSKQYTDHRLLSFAAAFVFLFAVYLEFVKLNLGSASLLQFFTFYYPAYCNPSHLIVGIGALPFLLLSQEKKVFGVVGLCFLPFLNAGLLVVPIVAIGIYATIPLATAIHTKSISKKLVLQQMTLLASAVTPLVYYKVTGRMFSTASLELSVTQVYLTMHTAIRALLSYIFIAPFLLGLYWFFSNQADKEKREIFWLVISFFIGTVVSFAVIFPIIQGNSIKILSIYFTAILAPVCVIGLVSLIRTGNRFVLVLAILCGSLILFQTIRVLANTGVYQLTFDWNTYIDGYRERVVVSKKTYSGMATAFAKKQPKVGYYLYNEEQSYGGTHYSSFTHLKGLFAGTVFYRMNAAVTDTLRSKEQLNHFKNTTLGHFAYQNQFDSAKVSQSMISYLKPEFIIRPVNGDYVFPEALIKTYKDTIEFEDIVLYCR